MRDGLVNCAMLTIVVFLRRSLAEKHDTVRTGGSLGLARNVYCLRFQRSSFFCGLLLIYAVEKDWFFLCDACGLTTLGFVGISFLIFRTIISLVSIWNRIKKSAARFVFPGNFAVVKFNCNTKSYAFYKGGGIIFVWRN